MCNYDFSLIFYGFKAKCRIWQNLMSFFDFFHISENARQFWLTATRQLGVPLWSTTLLMDFQGQKFTYIASKHRASIRGWWRWNSWCSSCYKSLFMVVDRKYWPPVTLPWGNVQLKVTLTLTHQLAHQDALHLLVSLQCSSESWQPWLHSCLNRTTTEGQQSKSES